MLKPIPLEGVFAYLIYREKEAILVDCGPEGSAPKILRTMDKLGLDPTDLKLLVLTHTHFDHCGSAAQIREQTSCKVAVHHLEADRLRRGRAPFPGGTRWKARIVVFLGRVFRPLILRFAALEPDILLGVGSRKRAGEPIADLTEFGFNIKVFHLPGHTIGSLGLLLPDGTMLVGDALTGVPGMKLYPAFAESRRELDRSWKLLGKMPLKKIYPAHGVAVTMDRFLAELPRYVGAS